MTVPVLLPGTELVVRQAQPRGNGTFDPELALSPLT